MLFGRAPLKPVHLQIFANLRMHYASGYTIDSGISGTIPLL